MLADRFIGWLVLCAQAPKVFGFTLSVDFETDVAQAWATTWMASVVVSVRPVVSLTPGETWSGTQRVEVRL
jgi:hypothetical protein